MVEKENSIEAWFERRRLTLDLAGLSASERAEGSILLGGSGAEFVVPGDSFEYNEVNMVVFEWGDPTAEEMFNILIEHDDNPEPDFLFPFHGATIIGDKVWGLAVQKREFEPHLAYGSDAQYIVLPFEKKYTQARLNHYLSMAVPRPELLGKVGPRWVAFELGVDIR